MEHLIEVLLNQLVNKATMVEHKLQKYAEIIWLTNLEYFSRATHDTGKAIAELENQRIERKKAVVGGKNVGPKVIYYF